MLTAVPIVAYIATRVAFSAPEVPGGQYYQFFGPGLSGVHSVRSTLSTNESTYALAINYTSGTEYVVQYTPGWDTSVYSRAWYHTQYSTSALIRIGGHPYVFAVGGAMKRPASLYLRTANGSLLGEWELSGPGTNPSVFYRESGNTTDIKVYTWHGNVNGACMVYTLRGTPTVNGTVLEEIAAGNHTHGAVQYVDRSATTTFVHHGKVYNLWVGRGATTDRPVYQRILFDSLDWEEPRFVPVQRCFTPKICGRSYMTVASTQLDVDTPIVVVGGGSVYGNPHFSVFDDLYISVDGAVTFTLLSGTIGNVGSNFGVSLVASNGVLTLVAFGGELSIGEAEPDHGCVPGNCDTLLQDANAFAATGHTLSIPSPSMYAISLRASRREYTDVYTVPRDVHTPHTVHTNCTQSVDCTVVCDDGLSEQQCISLCLSQIKGDANVTASDVVCPSWCINNSTWNTTCDVLCAYTTNTSDVPGASSNGSVETLFAANYTVNATVVQDVVSIELCNVTLWMPCTVLNGTNHSVAACNYVEANSSINGTMAYYHVVSVPCDDTCARTMRNITTTVYWNETVSTSSWSHLDVEEVDGFPPVASHIPTRTLYRNVRSTPYSVASVLPVHNDTDVVVVSSTHDWSRVFISYTANDTWFSRPVAVVPPVGSSAGCAYVNGIGPMCLVTGGGITHVLYVDGSVIGSVPIPTEYNGHGVWVWSDAPYTLHAMAAGGKSKDTHAVAIDVLNVSSSAWAVAPPLSNQIQLMWNPLCLTYSVTGVRHYLWIGPSGAFGSKDTYFQRAAVGDGVWSVASTLATGKRFYMSGSVYAREGYPIIAIGGGRGGSLETGFFSDLFVSVDGGTTFSEAVPYSAHGLRVGHGIATIFRAHNYTTVAFGGGHHTTHNGGRSFSTVEVLTYS